MVPYNSLDTTAAAAAVQLYKLRLAKVISKKPSDIVYVADEAF